jgi:hypothetical protein
LKYVRELLNSLPNSLYLFEPGDSADARPICTTARSLSTFSQCLDQTHAYDKYMLPMYLYMSCWELEELLTVAEVEMLDFDKVATNFYMFGGIARRTLLMNDTSLQVLRRRLNAACIKANANTIRAVHDIIGDNSDTTKRLHRSGFLVCHKNISIGNINAFHTYSLGMTSEYAYTRFQQNLCLNSTWVRECMERLADQIHTHYRTERER